MRLSIARGCFFGHGKEHAFAKLLKSALLARPPLTGTLSRPSGIWSIQGKWRIARLANAKKEDFTVLKTLPISLHILIRLITRRKQMLIIVC